MKKIGIQDQEDDFGLWRRVLGVILDCEPELDTSPELGPDLASLYGPTLGAPMDPRAWEGRHCNGSFHACRIVLCLERGI